MESSGSSIELPDVLHDKYQELKIANGHIDELELQLIVARKSRDKILEEISAVHQSRALIAKVPFDVLLTIFEFWDDDPLSRNRTLSLVCKTWYQIVHTSARFWTNVVLRFGWDLRGIKSTFRFSELCHQLSKNQLLNVKIDLRGMLSYPRYISRVLEESSAYFQELDWPEAGISFDVFADLLTDVLRGVDSREGPGGSLYEHLPESIIRKLTQDMEQVRRWKSLQIWIPEHLSGYPAEVALNAAKGDFPNLEKLLIVGGLSRSLLDKMDFSMTCPKLRNFTSNQDIALDNVLRYPASLESVCIRGTGITGAFLSLPSKEFANLRRLQLQDDGHIFHAWPKLEVALFERLTSLHISTPGRFLESMIDLIEAPMLELLHLHQFDTVPFQVPNTPFLSQIKLLLIERDITTANSAHIGIDVFKELLRRTSSLYSLKLFRADWPEAQRILTAVNEIREEGYPLRNLKKIILVHGVKDIMARSEANLTVLKVLS